LIGVQVATTKSLALGQVELRDGGRKMRPIGAAFSLLVCFPLSAAAQCDPQWLTGHPLPGVNNSVYGMALWSAAPGLPKELVVAGGFTLAGETMVDGIAAWSPEAGTWRRFPDLRFITQLLVHPDGSLLACTSRPHRFDGSRWINLAPGGVTGGLRTLAVLPGGDVVAGGAFSAIDGVAANHIARFDGRAWTPLGYLPGHSVLAITGLPNGEIIAGGRLAWPFTNAARWDGASWHPTGWADENWVGTLAVLPDGQVVAGGSFGARRWNGSTWSPMGTPGWISHLHVRDSGELLAAAGQGVLRWTGASWTPVGGSMDFPANVVTTDEQGRVYAGGEFIRAGSTAALRIARWSGQNWRALGRGATGIVSSLAPALNGDFYAAGWFDVAEGEPWRFLARWDHGQSQWARVGLGAPNGMVSSVVRSVAGDLYIGGGFLTIGGVSARHMAHWDGDVWRPLGQGPGAAVYSIALLPGGDLVVAGEFPSRIARWNGAAWSAVGGGIDGAVFGIAPLPDGGILAYGTFQSAGGQPASNVAVWNGSSWNILAGGTNQTVRAAAVLPGGDLVVGGEFSQAGGQPASLIARWDGQAWHALGSGLSGCAGAGCRPVVNALTVSAGGDLIVGGYFLAAGGISVSNLARWDGENWHPVRQGVNGQVHSLAVLANGELVAGGGFTVAGDTGSSAVARLGCPAPVCYANCDGSTAPPILNIHDFNCFLGQFAIASTLPREQQITHYANCDGSTATPVLNVDDFICFIRAFAAGCD
jgi:trimeric autotransporter adhesin